MEKIVWAFGALIVGGYVLLFVLARRPVALRATRVGGLVAGIALLRLALVVGGPRFAGPLDVIATVLLGLLAITLLLFGQRTWLVRATADELRGQIETGCRGLFLGLQASRPDQVQLIARGEPILHLRRLAPRMQLLVLCRVAGPGKVALLCHWLAKQYPGPVPRVRFIFKGDDS